MEEKIIYINGEESNYKINEYGEVFNKKNNHKLTPRKQNGGIRYTLSIKGKPISIMAHLLMKDFLGEKPREEAIIKHKDGNKYNNYKDNLYWYYYEEDDEWKKIYIDGLETPFRANRLGEIKNSKTGNILKGTLQSGYKFYNLSWQINGKRFHKLKSGHRIIAETFLSNPNNLPCVHHIDHNKLNNQVINLQWVSIQENNSDVLPPQQKSSTYSLTINSLPNEIWMNYKDTIYQVSNLGRVKNLTTNKILKGTLRPDGYVSIKLNKETYLLHSLVVSLFLRPLTQGEVIDHLNGNKTDNRLENLEIVTLSENSQRARNNNKGNVRKVGKFDIELNLIQTYPSLAALAREFKVSSQVIIEYLKMNKLYKNTYFFKYLDESSQTNRDENPEARSTIENSEDMVETIKN